MNGVLDTPAIQIGGAELPINSIVEYEEIAVRQDQRSVLAPRPVEVDRRLIPKLDGPRVGVTLNVDGRE